MIKPVFKLNIEFVHNRAAGPVISSSFLWRLKKEEAGKNGLNFSLTGHYRGKKILWPEASTRWV
jgi:hypothetical protein